MAATDSMSKGLYSAPQGLESLGESIEIEMDEDTDSTVNMLPDGGAEIIMGEAVDEADESDFEANLAEHMDEGVLHSLSNDLIELFEADMVSRKDWADTFVKGLEVLGFKYEERTEPWDDACGVYSTVLAEAAIRFQAETMSETFPAAGPVKTKILGKVTKEKEEASERVKNDMNYQLTERMVE